MLHCRATVRRVIPLILFALLAADAPKNLIDDGDFEDPDAGDMYQQYDKGDTMAEALDYIPMPDPVVASVKKTWANEIKDASGKPLYAVTN